MNAIFIFFSVQKIVVNYGILLQQMIGDRIVLNQFDLYCEQNRKIISAGAGSDQMALAFPLLSPFRCLLIFRRLLLMSLGSVHSFMIWQRQDVSGDMETEFTQFFSSWLVCNVFISTELLKAVQSVMSWTWIHFSTAKGQQCQNIKNPVKKICSIPGISQEKPSVY